MHLRPAAWEAQQHHVICVSHERGAQRALTVHPVVQPVKIQVGEQRGETSTLRYTAAIGPHRPLSVFLLYDRSSQEAFDQTKHRTIAYSSCHQSKEARMRNRVKIRT